jgi:hypothetical protein
MKKTIDQIIDKISKVAEDRRTSAGYAGERHDGGASKLEELLSFFKVGVKSGYLAAKEQTELLEVPTQWEGYFIDEDPEYQEFLRLKQIYDAACTSTFHKFVEWASENGL